MSTMGFLPGYDTQEHEQLRVEATVLSGQNAGVFSIYGELR
jgi:hypothetical protein